MTSENPTYLRTQFSYDITGFGVDKNKNGFRYNVT